MHDDGRRSHAINIIDRRDSFDVQRDVLRTVYSISDLHWLLYRYTYARIRFCVPALSLLIVIAVVVICRPFKGDEMFSLRL